jgi:hyperosmotically inducible periplasmic protein
MLRLIKFIVVLVVVFILVAFLLGRWTKQTDTAGPTLDQNKARETAGKVGEAAKDLANEAVHEAKDALEEGRITAKIKSKMALDDLVKARNIDVDTNGSVVTLTGVVASEAERQRAVQLAQQTEGVASVINHIKAP